MPTSHARGDARSRSLASRRPLLLLAAALALPAPAAIAAGESTYRLTRSDLALQIDRGLLGAWSPLTERGGAIVDFEQVARNDRLLRLADSRDDAGYVVVAAPLGPKTVVTIRAEVNLLRQYLRRGKVRSLIAVTGRDGSSYQAGVYRAPAGHMRWAVWTKDASGGIRALRVAAVARLGAFHDLGLSTRWGGARSRAVLAVDGKAVARTPLERRATAGTRAIVGLGRVSKRTETGAMVVRSVHASTANPTAVSPRAGVSPPAGSAPSVAPGAAGGDPTAPSAAEAPLPGTEIFVGDFETGTLGQWGGMQRVASDRLSVVRSPVRQGSFAARFEVRNGDNPIGYGDRAEVQGSTNESEGNERWYSWSTMFAGDYPRSAAWQVVSQWHAKADGSPPLGFFAENDDLLLRVHRADGPGSLLDVRTIWRGSLRRGQWQDIRIHVKWSGSDSVGYVELWINGVRQSFDNGSTRRSIRTLIPGVGAYFKQGLYRQSGVAATGVLYHDGLRITSVN